MPPRSSFAAGDPCWIDLVTTDRDRSRAFYAAIFGWEITEGHATEAPYLIARLGGRTVAGISDAIDGGPPPGWTVYFSCPDAQMVSDRARVLGGTVITPPAAEQDNGAVTVFRDPLGAVAGGWRPGRVAGAQLIGEPGALAWVERVGADPDAAHRFHDDVFGVPSDPAFVRFGARAPGSDYWLPVLLVDDRADFLAKVQVAGGRLPNNPPSDSGSPAMLADPSGAWIGVNQKL